MPKTERSGAGWGSFGTGGLSKRQTLTTQNYSPQAQAPVCSLAALEDDKDSTQPSLIRIRRQSSYLDKTPDVIIVVFPPYILAAVRYYYGYSTVFSPLPR